ncbi:MAG: DNA adenine methylase [Spirochaetales bacterium]|nr:DNA adenine methylase [Spirochaetales bacterium]
MNFEQFNQAEVKAYLSRQIIAYIGNKRKLLPLIFDGIKESFPNGGRGYRFFDAFAGSGVVSRLAKAMGFSVLSNDWEEYSRVINSTFLGLNPSELDILIGPSFMLNNWLEAVNNLSDPHPEEEYIARYYGPKSFDISNVDYNSQRLFYTRYNALIIDRVRNYIDVCYPEKPGGWRNNKIRNFLITLLLYKAATHTNTSGVFKAYHKGFGGHNGDALSRILRPIRLEAPVLLESDQPMEIFNCDANLLVRQSEMEDIDIAYLDPPYNQHQYGSNYHMLNSIARWDKIPHPLELDQKGRLKEKAAIRKDWVNTRSPYCYRDQAEVAFSDLIGNLKAKLIFISYSTDGIISFEKLQRICEKKGRLSLYTNQYIKYRGGKQSNQGKSHNIEFLLRVESNEPATLYAKREIQRLLALRKAHLELKNRFKKQALAREFYIEKGNVYFESQNRKLPFKKNHLFDLEFDFEPSSLSLEELQLLNQKLHQTSCQSKEEELEEILTRIREQDEDIPYFVKLLPDTLQKLAHKKNRPIFERYMKRIEALKAHRPDVFSSIERKLNNLNHLAEKRFTS